MESHLPRTAQHVPTFAPSVDRTAPPFGGAAGRGQAPTVDDGTHAGAVEIAAMLGDSVVGVKHCVDPRSGKVSRTTSAMFAIGLVCLLSSGLAFVSSVRNAAFNSGKLAYWTQVEHKPAHAFRPLALSPVNDVLAFGGLALALLTLTAGLVRLRNDKRSPYYRIGTAAGVEQPALGAPTASFPLVAPAGDDFVFNYGDGIDGEVIVDGTSTPFAQLAATGRSRPSPTTVGAIEIPISARAKIRARVGQTTFLVSAVGKPRRQATAAFGAFESRAAVYFGASLAAHLAVWAFLQTVPVEGSAPNLALGEIDDTGIHLSDTAHDTAPDKPIETDGIASASDGGHPGAAMQLPGGAMGNPTSSRDAGHYAIKQTSDTPALARQQAIEEARTAGILGSTELNAVSMTSITGTADIASAFNDATIYGGLIGDEVGAMKGGFGYGRWGFGPGGNGGEWGTVGSGKYWTIGSGNHAGDRYNVGVSDGPGGRKHVGVLPSVVIGEAHPPGFDGSIIRRYIRRNIEKISYCYDKELMAHPGIEGTVQVQFFISPTGTVSASNGAGFDGNVAGCVASVVKSIEFPKPPDGGVQVNYPFTFHAANANAK